MKKSIAFCAALSLLCGAVAFAAPPKKGAKKTDTSKAVKVVDVWTCPMTGEKTTAAHQAGTPVVVGKYRVHFCCGGCPEAFAKLSAKEKLSKAEIAAKKDAAKPDASKKS